MLTNFGEFYPFASALDLDGDVSGITACDEEENPHSRELIERLRERARMAAASGYFSATAVAYDARVQIDDRDIDSDAVVIEVDLVGDEAAVVFMLYRRTQRNIEYGDVLVQPGTGEQYGVQ